MYSTHQDQQKLLHFEPDCMYPWLAPLLEGQYETNVCAEDLMECRYKDTTDKYIAYKTDD